MPRRVFTSLTARRLWWNKRRTELLAKAKAITAGLQVITTAGLSFFPSFTIARGKNWYCQEKLPLFNTSAVGEIEFTGGFERGYRNPMRDHVTGEWKSCTDWLWVSYRQTMSFLPINYGSERAYFDLPKGEKKELFFVTFYLSVRCKMLKFRVFAANCPSERKTRQNKRRFVKIFLHF